MGRSESQDDRGVLFVATSEEFLQEATSAARRVRELKLDIDICIVTDQEPSADVFDRVIHIDDPTYGFGDKVESLRKSPYEKTLYLDTDVYVCNERAIDDLFALLDRFDIAASIDEGRRHELIHGSDFEVSAPDSLPMVNTGVLPYRTNEKTAEMFEEWHNSYERHYESAGNVNDQPALREALYQSEVRIAPLPPEFNCRLPYSQRLVGPVRVLHGRATNITEIATTLCRESCEPRIVTPAFVGPKNLPIGYETEVKIITNPGKGRITLEKVKLALRNCGVLKTILIVALGGSSDGYLRVEKISKSIQNDGLVETGKNVIKWVNDKYLPTK